MRFGYVLLGLVTLAFFHVSRGQECSNGLEGVQRGGICCAASCGVCGGSNCGALPGGRENCCTGVIVESGDMCSMTMASPCMIDDEMVCSNGLLGVENVGICCEAQCGRCGGSRCGRLPGGPSACCTRAITLAGDMCSETMAAPCIIDDGLVCSNGFTGVERDGVCCEAQCGTCGGRGCAGRSGGADACCIGEIQDPCSETMQAPCIIVL